MKNLKIKKTLPIPLNFGMPYNLSKPYSTSISGSKKTHITKIGAQTNISSNPFFSKIPFKFV